MVFVTDKDFERLFYLFGGPSEDPFGPFFRLLCVLWWLRGFKTSLQKEKRKEFGCDGDNLLVMNRFSQSWWIVLLEHVVDIDVTYNMILHLELEHKKVFLTSISNVVRQYTGHDFYVNLFSIPPKVISKINEKFEISFSKSRIKNEKSMII